MPSIVALHRLQFAMNQATQIPLVLRQYITKLPVKENGRDVGGQWIWHSGESPGKSVFFHQGGTRRGA